MTDEQIMQGLKWCYQVEGSCGDCPYRPNDIKKARCHDRLGNDVIDLIRRQQAEIKWLKDALQTQTDILESGANSYEPVFEEEKIKAEAIKEFMEKLIEIGTEDGAYGYVGVLEIERAAKEMVGDSNA